MYAAEHAHLGTPAAVKILTRGDERARARFEREAKLLSTLKSPAFPRFFAYGDVDGTEYIAMELLEPGELPVGERAIAKFLLNVCDAVSELHGRGLVHRDIKPANILWRRKGKAPSPVLADLGLVKDIGRREDAMRLPRQDSVVTIGGVGTLGYGAPEQMERGEATEASDIHALGVLANRCFDENPPAAWARIIRRATSSIPSQRYPSVESFARAIRHMHAVRNSLLAIVLVLIPCAILSVVIKREGKFIPKESSNAPLGYVAEPGAVDSGYVGAATWNAEIRNFDLRGRKLVLKEPIVLEDGGVYRIRGPGRIDVDMTCSTTATVHISDCDFINRTTKRGLAAGVLYHLDGGCYLNFPNLPPDGISTSGVSKYIFLDDRARMNYYRFQGPSSLGKLLMDEM